jgi:hypothetical protein
MFLGFVSMQAQKVVKGSFSALANESAVSVKIDYTDSRIDKVPFEIFLEGEENWDEGYREILFKFVKAANQNSSGLKYLTKQTENYQLVFKAVTVDDDGNTTGSLCLMDKDNQVVAEAGKFKANGGRFGSQMNLMGDAAERLGKKVAKFIEKAIK